MCRTLPLVLAALTLAATTASQEAPKIDRFVPPPPPMKTAPAVVELGPPPATLPGDAIVTRPTKPLDMATRPAAAAGFDATRVYLEELGPDDLWAATGRYKVHVTPRGVTCVPFLGAAAPHNWPLQLRLARAAVADRELPLPEHAALTRDGDSVALHHGTIVERWLLRANEAEQSFVILDLPARGALVLELEVSTDLDARPLDRGFEFVGPDGGVRYGGAVAFDAAGRRTDVASELHGARLVHRLPAAFVADAMLPIVIDPIVSFFSGAQTAYDQGRPDVAFEAGSELFMVVNERRYSATDGDVWSELRDVDGQLVPGSGGWIDVTTDDWRKPQVAANRAASRFLVVAQARGAGASTTEVRGRIRDATGPFASGQQFTISTGANACFEPDVGGDGNPSGPDYWAVVWQYAYSATDADIHYRMVAADGTFTSSSALVLDNSTADDVRPRISKCNGRSDYQTQSWMVVFSRAITATQRNTHAATLGWNGAITQGTFRASSVSDISPDVSSPTEVVFGRRYHVIASEYVVSPTDHDIWVGLHSGNQYFAGVNITSDSTLDVDPTIDGDGYRFAVTYGYAFDVPTNDYDVYVRTVGAMFTPNSIGFGVIDPAVAVASRSVWEGRPAIAARHLNGDGRYMIAYEDSNAAQPSIVRGAIYEVLGPGGLTLLPHGCDGFPITAIGEPLIGRRVTLQVPGPGGWPSTSGLLFGVLRQPPIQLPLCAVPCFLGVDGAAYPSLIHIDIPVNFTLVGAVAGVQGWDLVGGSCFNAGVRLSDTVVITVR